MKDLYSIVEGILDIDDEKLDKMTDDALIFDWIETYLKPHNPKAQFKLDSKGKVHCIENGFIINIVFDGFDELPEYVSFSDQRITYLSMSTHRGSKIKSFRGLPTKVKCLTIDADIKCKTPDWCVDDVDYFRLQGINASVETLKLLKIKGKNITLTFESTDIGREISRQLNSEASTNNLDNSEPITSSELNIISKLFKGVVDLKDVNRINYTARFYLLKHNGKFYNREIL